MPLAYLISAGDGIRVTGDFADRTFSDLTQALSYVADADIIAFAPGTYPVRTFTRDTERRLYLSHVFDKPVTLVGIGNPIIKAENKNYNRIFILEKGGRVEGLTIDGGGSPEAHASGAAIVSLGDIAVSNTFIKNTRREALTVWDSSATVVGYRAENVWTGFVAFRAGRVTVHSSEITNTGGDAIFVAGGKGVRVFGNHVCCVGDTGIDFHAYDEDHQVEDASVVGNVLEKARVGFSGVKKAIFANNVLVNTRLYAHQGGGKVEELRILSNTFHVSDDSVLPAVLLDGVCEAELSNNSFAYDGSSKSATAVSAFVGRVLARGNVAKGFPTFMRMHGTYNGEHVLIDNLIEGDNAVLFDFNNLKGKLFLKDNVFLGEGGNEYVNKPETATAKEM
jgi:hypothetical protein